MFSDPRWLQPLPLCAWFLLYRFRVSLHAFYVGFEVATAPRPYIIGFLVPFFNHQALSGVRGGYCPLARIFLGFLLSLFLVSLCHDFVLEVEIVWGRIT